MSSVQRRFYKKKIYSSWTLNTSITCNVTPCSLVVRYKCTDVSEGPPTSTITYFNLDYPPFHTSLFLLSDLFHFIGYFPFSYHSLMGYFGLFHVKRSVDTAPRILRICIRLKFSDSFFGHNTPVHDVGCMEHREDPEALVLPVNETGSNEPQAVTSRMCSPEFTELLNTNECAVIYYISLKFTLKYLKRSYMFRSLGHPQGAYIVPC
jgi:hypothetical protein